ncbi:hypothetical protein L1987_38819 [Smallanthus sonchifolius]|uniref:Uncharacterized protein n=1 Tax=Smallanthus sonchifolius TaxID=185202 RepID=A0ACB9HK20_9ASTR|nr:hypothetical protein L1987_38819 [Smallanthus sonchifolius]
MSLTKNDLLRWIVSYIHLSCTLTTMALYIVLFVRTMTHLMSRLLCSFRTQMPKESQLDSMRIQKPATNGPYSINHSWEHFMSFYVIQNTHKKVCLVVLQTRCLKDPSLAAQGFNGVVGLNSRIQIGENR